MRFSMTDFSDVSTGTQKNNSGRPHLDGSRPGLGVYLRRVSMTIPPDYAELLEELGEGNRSAGVRRLVDFYHEMTLGTKRNLAEGEAIFKSLGLG